MQASGTATRVSTIPDTFLRTAVATLSATHPSFACKQTASPLLPTTIRNLPTVKVDSEFQKEYLLNINWTHGDAAQYEQTDMHFLCLPFDRAFPSTWQVNCFALYRMLHRMHMHGRANDVNRML